MYNLYLLAALQYNKLNLDRNTEGLTQAESLAAPGTAGGNCINWNLGHILVYRGRMLEALGGKPVLNQAEVELYQRGSSALGPDSKEALPVERLVSGIKQTGEEMQTRLRELDPAQVDRVLDPFPIARPVELPTVGTFLSMMLVHESYHAGQIGLTRRLQGK
ncbi:DinB family protein [bacterium]|nr:DinB family protein [bacterium]